MILWCALLVPVSLIVLAMVYEFGWQDGYRASNELHEMMAEFEGEMTEFDDKESHTWATSTTTRPNMEE